MSQEVQNRLDECNEIVTNTEYESSKDIFEESILKGIKITDENDFNLASKHMKEYLNFDINNAEWLKSSRDKNIAENMLNSFLSLINASDDGVILKKDWEKLSVYNASKNQDNKNALLGEIINWDKMTDLYDKKFTEVLLSIDIKDINTVDNSIQLFEEKCRNSINVKWEVKSEIELTKRHITWNNIKDTTNIELSVTSEITEFPNLTVSENIVQTEAIPQITHNTTHWDITETAKKHLDTNKNNTSTDALDTWNNTNNISHDIAKWETIWDILQSDKFNFSEQQANTAIKKLRNNTDILSQLKSNDIDTIYPGETIEFSQKLLTVLKTQESIPESTENTWSHTVKKGDTPSKILFEYEWVNWENVANIAAELNMTVIKLGETITLEKTITLNDGTKIKKA